MDFIQDDQAVLQAVQQHARLSKVPSVFATFKVQIIDGIALLGDLQRQGCLAACLGLRSATAAWRFSVFVMSLMASLGIISLQFILCVEDLQG